MNVDMKYMNELEVLINLFTIDKDGILKILLIRREMDPYRGYWMLPTSLLLSNETIDECAAEALYDWVGLKDVYIEQCNIYSNLNRIPVERVIGNSIVGIVDIQTFEWKRKKRNDEMAWFPVNAIPKVVYDHSEIIEDAVKYVRRRLKNINYLKNLFPSDFSLPELQLVYEQVLGHSLDRRNFRKKVMNMDILEDTGDKNELTNGRPAKLYQFKEDISDDLELSEIK